MTETEYTKTEKEMRADFEEWISSPPIEANIHRRSMDAEYCWPGTYVDYSVELAWATWQEAHKQQNMSHKPT